MKPLLTQNRNMVFFLAFILLVFSGFATRSRASASQVDVADPVVVRVYYGFRENLDILAGMLDIWEVNHDQAYLLALVSPERYLQLNQAGYRLEIDTGKSATINQPNQPLPGQGIDTIPGYPCYRTVEDTYEAMEVLAANNPTLATWIDIGDSWDKLQAGDPPGYDIYALELTNKTTPGTKPVFFLMAEIHAREYSTAETAARFAEYLAANYGIDPDITWLLDYYKVTIVPMINPDGRKWAETGILWRKNTNTVGCSFPDYGIDLNRNHSFHWGGASSYPCSEVYQGPYSLSEPETNVIQNQLLSMFSDQRGPLDADPAPADTTGVFITLHSYSQLVLWPWGWTGVDAPNHIQLQTLGRKMAYFNNYTPQQSNDLYETTGTSDDWAYGELGIAAYTFEMGTSFFQSCTTFESTIYPNNRDALLYAFKASRHPYMDPSGPDSLNVTVTPSNVQPGTPVMLEATANDTRFRSGTGEPTQNISAARYTIDDPSWITETVVYAMTADDGGFNEKIEDVSATVDTSCLAPGQHALFVESKDVNNDWGVPGAVFLTVGESSGVSVSPKQVEGMTTAGQTITYTLDVNNLGNAMDTFTVDLEGIWPVSAPLEIPNLAGCNSTFLDVTVLVPESVTIGMSDMTSITITSQSDPDQYTTAWITTTVAGSPPEVDPLVAYQSGDPGMAIMYTLSITNSNNITDTFDILVSSGWLVDAPSSIGPFEPYGNDSLVVTVTVPITAPYDTLDVASVRITSQNPAVLPITATLNTTVNGMYGVSVDSLILRQSALPGETTTYTLQITNTGRISDTYDISITHSWDTLYSTPVGPLAVGETTGLTVVVTLPISVSIGMSDTATVTITSQGDPERRVVTSLVTTTKGNIAWIPIVVK